MKEKSKRDRREWNLATMVHRWLGTNISPGTLSYHDPTVCIIYLVLCIANCLVYSMQCVVCRVQLILFSMQCTAWIVQWSLYIQFAIWSVYTAVRSVQCVLCSEYCTLVIPLCLYLCTSIGSITSAFFLNLGIEKTGCFIKLLVVVNMVFNFLITDKSIMAERSFVPSKVSKCLTTSSFSSTILVHKRQGKFGWSKDKSEVSEPNTPFSSLWCNWLDQMVVDVQNFYTIILTN